MGHVCCRQGGSKMAADGLKASKEKGGGGGRQIDLWWTFCFSSSQLTELQTNIHSWVDRLPVLLIKLSWDIFQYLFGLWSKFRAAVSHVALGPMYVPGMVKRPAPVLSMLSCDLRMHMNSVTRVFFWWWRSLSKLTCFWFHALFLSYLTDEGLIPYLCRAACLYFIVFQSKMGNAEFYFKIRKCHGCVVSILATGRRGMFGALICHKMWSNLYLMTPWIYLYQWKIVLCISCKTIIMIG